MKKFKKILFVLLAALLVLSLGACAAPGTAAPELSVSSEAPNPSASSYEDNLEGLIQYMRDSELITGDGITMSADFIGAVAGQKFTFKYLEATMSCELYEFDPENLGPKGEPVMESIKKDGTFTVLDKQVAASLSDSGKFVMVFVSSSNDEAHLPFIDKVNEKFSSFQGK